MSVSTGEAGPVGYIGDYPVPIVGRVSMDFITVDVTSVPPRAGPPRRLGGGDRPPRQPSTTSTDRAGTIGYELLSRLGQRVHRVYERAPERTWPSPAKSQFVCQNCGAVASRWAGKCAACGEWNTMIEEADAVAARRAPG